MKRNITITINDSVTDKNFIHIGQLSSIVNFSCDSVLLNILEYLQEKDHNIVIATLLEKLRPGGKLIIAFNNAKHIAKEFVRSSISCDVFLNFFRNKQSLVSLDSLYTMINFEQFNIIDIDINTNTTKLVLERKI
jgi:predicted SAM-dependent methyltransferase